ncbi:hypothetical protein ACFFNY_35295 [Paenibacillus hodogayensis]|uniref:Uncharacterized protein n=1 Tax=Paenibacillus hodogayensis TaxID=279208 RepID=A0ABV5W9D9_9BACL
MGVWDPVLDRGAKKGSFDGTTNPNGIYETVHYSYGHPRIRTLCAYDFI